MFQRQGPAAYKADLSATRLLCAALGNPERQLRVVHVAGTNGKGTVCHMVAAALQKAGHRVGLFTSPHLVDFRERIRLNGQCIDEGAVVDFVQRWQDAGEEWGAPSFFELTFGMALDFFVSANCDIVVLETGMGGRLDSTNVVPAPEVTCVTNVGLDHQAFLGTDIRTIAREKAGIFKDGVPVVLGPMRPEAQSEMLAAALRTSSEVRFARDAEPEMLEMLEVLTSPVDRANASTAWAILLALRAVGWSISDTHIAEGLRRHREISGQRGRWQCVELTRQALVVLDGAHNLDGVRAITTALAALVKNRGGGLRVVWGTVNDKDPSDVMALLPRDAIYHWCAADIPRAMPPDRVAEVRPDLRGEVFDTPLSALRAALKSADEQDVVWVGGSLFVVGDVLRDAPGQVREWPSLDEGLT